MDLLTFFIFAYLEKEALKELLKLYPDTGELIGFFIQLKNLRDE